VSLKQAEVALPGIDQTNGASGVMCVRGEIAQWLQAEVPIEKNERFCIFAVRKKEVRSSNVGIIRPASIPCERCRSIPVSSSSLSAKSRFALMRIRSAAAIQPKAPAGYRKGWLRYLSTRTRTVRNNNRFPGEAGAANNLLCGSAASFIRSTTRVEFFGRSGSSSSTSAARGIPPESTSVSEIDDRAGLNSL